MLWEAWGPMRQVVGVLQNQTYMAPLSRHPCQHLHDCVTWACRPRRYLLIEGRLPPPHCQTQKLLHCYFVTDSRLGRKAQAAQARLEVALHQVRAVHSQQEQQLKHLRNLRVQVPIDHW